MVRSLNFAKTSSEERARGKGILDSSDELSEDGLPVPLGEDTASASSSVDESEESSGGEYPLGKEDMIGASYLGDKF